MEMHLNDRRLTFCLAWCRLFGVTGKDLETRADKRGRPNRTDGTGPAAASGDLFAGLFPALFVPVGRPGFVVDLAAFIVDDDGWFPNGIGGW
jgi:hypothetical protein